MKQTTKDKVEEQTRLIGRLCGVCGVWVLSLMASMAAAPTVSTEKFAEPPRENRIIKIIHGWPDQAADQDRLIRQFKTQGFGGVVCNVSFDDYLESEPKWEAFVRAIKEARKAGLVLWLYDERGYPSGNAGGIVLRDHPEWEARGLLIADQECDGGNVRLDLPPGEPLLTAAFPVDHGVIDVQRMVNLRGQEQNGTLGWQAPNGRWRLIAITESRLFEGTHADGNLWQKLPYVNLLQAEPTARFLQVTHERYASHLGGDLGKYFQATFTDEPSLMSCFLKPMSYRPLPWSPQLPAEFERRRGYPLDESVIISLVAETGSAEKHRYDYWLTIGELVSENFFGQIQNTCRRLGVPSGGHLLMEESLAAHVPLYGDFFRCARRLDAPGMDCLTSVPSEVPWQVARLLASVAELEGKSIVMSETSDHSQVWRPAGDTRAKRIVTEPEIRGTCNRLMVGGVNAITSYFSFTGLSDDALRRLNDWVGRCSYMLTGGHQVADIAVVYPVESVWTRFVPSRVWANDATAAAGIEILFRSTADALFNAQRDFTFVDSRALTDAKVESGAMVHGSLRWRVVVLPGVDTLPFAAWENLARFVRLGGIAIALGTLPANSGSEFPSPIVDRFARELFGTVTNQPWIHTNALGGAGIFLPAGTEALLPLALDGLLDHDVKIDDPRSPLRVTHRRVAGREVYFVINDSGQPWSGRLEFSGNNGERWDPGAGRVDRLLTNGPIPLALGPYGAALFRFAERSLPRRRTIAAGALPNLSFKPTPAVVPTTAQGEFVHGELVRKESRSRSGAQVWQANGTITKGQVDTFLFAQFHYDPPLDLSNVGCLSVETRVPSGQQTATRLLVILHESGGGDFIADTGRSLAGPGDQRSLVPLSRFQHAGWSNDEDGLLDPKRVSDIRVGWGGYLGVEGEKVQFTLTPPELGSVHHVQK